MQSVTEDRGTVLVVVLIFAVVVAVFCMTSLMVSNRESQGTYAGIQRDKAFFVASAGLHDEVRTLKDMMDASSLQRSFEPFEALAGKTVIKGRPLMSNGMVVGEYNVVVESVTAVGASNRDVTITSTGWVPSADHPKATRSTITAVLRIGSARSEVFDYVYFINNWGWYYGSTIIANGNVRANGQFDFGGYASTINGIPRFKELSSGVFGEKVDDGGVYAAWDIVGGGNVKGATSGEQHMHAFDTQIPLPNLTDLSTYEETAKLKNSTIKVGGTTLTDAVVGDDPGEKSNLYLAGSESEPIVLDGPVVVRGDLIIQGYVTGKGSLYVQGNIYVAGDIKYKNPIQAPLSNPDADSMQQWLAANQDADALGLFAREHIVVGDYTSPYFNTYVGPWVRDQRNSSEEDAGEDGIPNTRPGRDGILGTADDDVLEGDGKWTTKHYTAEHAQDGLIPEGFHIGDAIPGSGEDIDGDGKYDPGTSVTEFIITTPLKSDYWTGNVPEKFGTLPYKDLCSEGTTITRLDGAFYTNHTFAMLTLAWGQDLNVNGCVVSRNEAIVYGTDHAFFNYDLRLLQENNPHALDLPKTWGALKMVMWRSN